MNKKELDLQQAKAIVEMNEKLDKILSLQEMMMHLIQWLTQKKGKKK